MKKKGGSPLSKEYKPEKEYQQQPQPQLSNDANASSTEAAAAMPGIRNPALAMALADGTISPNRLSAMHRKSGSNLNASKSPPRAKAVPEPF